MWRKAAVLRLGVITTPAKRVRSDSRCEAWATQLLRVVGLQLPFELADLDLVQRPDLEQRVDEKAIAARRRNPARRTCAGWR